MKPIKVTGDPTAVLGDTVNRLVRKFEYAPERTPGAGVELGGGGGMAHILIVSTSEPAEIQEKADYVVNETNASQELQAIFNSVGGVWSIWMAGDFFLDDDVTAPDGAWIRGLGYPFAEAPPE